jgi:hypothetical protein
MSRVHYTAAFTLPDGSVFTLTRGSRQNYGYTVAWLLLAGAGERLEQGAVIAKGFSRTRKNAERAAHAGLHYGPYKWTCKGRIVLFAGHEGGCVMPINHEIHHRSIRLRGPELSFVYSKLSRKTPTSKSL